MYKFVTILVLACVCLFVNVAANATPATLQSEIEGDWMAEGKFKVRITRNGDDYQGKIIWVKPGEQTKDVKNENKSLRNRDLVGIVMLDRFRYSQTSKQFIGGTVYLFPRGKTMTDAVLTVAGNQLKMKISIGFMSKTVALTRA